MIPIQADLLNDESIDSWLEYLADLNGCLPRLITGYKDVLNQDRALPLSRSIDDLTLLRIADNTGMSPDRLSDATLRRYRPVGLANVPGRASGEGTWSQVRGSGYCPKCLSDGGLRWKLPWHLRWFNICDEHHTVLADRCPSCSTTARNARTHHPRTIRSNASAWRLERCTYGCATEILAKSVAHTIDEDSAAYRTHSWLTTLLQAGSAEAAYSNGESLPAVSILTDAALLTRHALNAMTYTDGVGSIPDSPDPGDWTQQLTGSDFVSKPTGRSGVAAVTTSQFLIAQTAAINILTTSYSGRDLLGTWMSESRIKQVIGHLKRSHGTRTTAHLQRLLGWRRMPSAGTTSSDRLGRRRTQHSARALAHATPEAIDPMNLPSCIWRPVRDHAPEAPDRVARLLPLTMPIALAAMGRKVDYGRLAAEFGLDYGTDEIRYALNHLISNEHGTKMYDYLQGLHAHLRSCPPPIDYRRRRRLFPAPSDIGRNHTRSLARAADAYLTEAFTWKIRRYIWQLLSGSDPLVTYGTALLHGPAAYSYRKFVMTMPADLQDKAGEVAQRLLLKHRIGEPISYTPEFNLHTGTWAPRGREQRYLPDIGRSDLRRTSLSLTLAASTAGDPEELLHLALAGEKIAALRLWHFVASVQYGTETEAATALGIRQPQLSREYRYLSRSLGSDIFVLATRSQPRRLTPTGVALHDVARTYIDRLRDIAGLEALPPT